MLVRVTDDDIKRGKKREPGLCPIAWALRRETGTEHVTVAYEAVSIGPFVVHLPSVARYFAKSFDQGFRVSPFEFELPFTVIVDEAGNHKGVQREEVTV